ncbi:MAG: hypothetical protein KGI75_05900 [Rhizobiaceae bacterium]|nr:hypothetical protein [Rhizobiaceae bacterium]
MNVLLAGILSCGCVSLADGPLWTPAQAYINTKAECSQSSDPANCRHTRETWPRDYHDAVAGQYQGQRNVAFCLSTGCDMAISRDEVLGCAWRIVIVDSKHRELDSTDETNLKHFCGPDYLDETGQQAAKKEAERFLAMLGS